MRLITRITNRIRRGTRRVMGLPGLRLVACAITSLGLTLKGSPCWISYEKESRAYVHRFPQAVLVASEPRRLTPDWWQTRVSTTFFPHFRPGFGDVVLDVGAGVGTEAIFFSRLVGADGHVYSLEPHPATFRMLQTTIRRNQLRNVTALDIGLAATSGSAHMTDLAAHQSNTLSQKEPSGVRVMTMSLEELIEELGLKRVALLKMNVEGAEREILEASDAVLGLIDNVVISCHDFKAARTGDHYFNTRAFVQTHLAEIGFIILPPNQNGPGWLRDTVYACRATNPSWNQRQKLHVQCQEIVADDKNEGL